jgi:heterodisulfide reductase subunit C
MHPEQGPIWEYILENSDDVFERLGGQINGIGTGPLRKIPREALDELKKIFDVTGGTEFFDIIEEHSRRKASEMGLQFDSEGTDNDYFIEVYTANNGTHDTHKK